MRRKFIFIIIFLLGITFGNAQQYMGMSGLLHVPSADMDSAGVIKVGINFIPRNNMPDPMKILRVKNSEKYNSASLYISVSPFKWVEISAKRVLWKCHKDFDIEQPLRFYAFDSHVSLRIRPLYEGKYWPSVVIGGDDFWGAKDDGETGSGYFRNYYIATTKHFDFKGNLIGTHLTYRRWKQDYFQRFNGLIGGLTFQPAFYHPLRLVAEWDGMEVNAGVDCRIPLPFAGFGTGLLLQAGLLGGRDFFGGLALAIGLNGRH